MVDQLVDWKELSWVEERDLMLALELAVYSVAN